MAQTDVRRVLVYALIVSSLIMLFVFFYSSFLAASIPVIIKMVKMTKGA